MRNTFRRSLWLILLFVIPLGRAYGGVLIPPTVASVTCPTGLTAGGPTGTYTVTLTGPAPAATTATPDRASAGIVSVPPAFTIPTGATTFTFQVTPLAVGNSDVGVTVNGSRRDCNTVVAAAVVPGVTVTSGPTLSFTGLAVLSALLALAGLIVVRRA